MRRNNKGDRRDGGFVAVVVLLLLTLFVASGMALLDNQSGALRDSSSLQGNAQATFMAQSGFQEGMYYASKLNTSWTGTSPEQTVTGTNGKAMGSFEYTVSRNGSTTTVAATGYVPNKTTPRSVSVMVSGTFTQGYIGTGIVVLEPTAAGSVSLNGNAQITIYGGKLYVDSTSATAVSATGNATIVAPEMDFSGNVATSGNAHLSGTVKANQPAVPDPLAALPALTTSGLTVRKTSAYSINGAATLDPGVYTGGISLSGNASVTMNPGIYYINGGGISMSGNAVLTGNGVMIYNAGVGSIGLSGNGSVTLTPQTTGTYKNIMIFQDRASTSALTMSGNGALKVRGTVYAAAATLSLSGNGSIPNVGSLDVVKKISINGNGNVTVNNY